MGLFSKVTDAIGLTDSGAGKKAAGAAAQYSKKAAEAARLSTTGGYDASKAALLDAFNQASGTYQQGVDQGLASLQAGYGSASGMLNPLSQAGIGALGSLQQSATPQGFASNIQALQSGGALDPLIAENRRNIEAELSAQGLGRSGFGITELSQIPIETIMGIEGMLQGRNQQVAGLGLPALGQQAGYAANLGQQQSGIQTGLGYNLGNLQSGYGANLGNLESSYGQNMANLDLGLGQNMSSAVLAGAQAEAADRAVLAQIMGAAAGAAGASASDIRLKKNIKQIGAVGELNLYTWDWNDEGAGIGDKDHTQGFIAQEVEKLYPEYITDIKGYKAIKYKQLLDKLESENAHFTKH